MNGEYQLACAVITTAIRDFKRADGADWDTYRFLTGKTEIARFWFQAANVPPMRGSRLTVLEKLRSVESKSLWAGQYD